MNEIDRKTLSIAERDNYLFSKLKKNETKPKQKKDDYLDIIQTCEEKITEHLGNKVESFTLIRKSSDLTLYIDRAIEDGVISIDTETTGLNVRSDKILGICTYSPSNKAAYIPLHHTDYITKEELKGQIKHDDLIKQFLRLKQNKTKIIMFNAKFDLGMFLNFLKLDLDVYWDGFVAANLLNENEQKKDLKNLHQKYCLSKSEEPFRFNHLFKGLELQSIPLKVMMLYGANDAIITYELFKFQEKFLDTNMGECKKRNLQRVANVFHNIEMPLIKVILRMEQEGIKIDTDRANELNKLYNLKLKDSLDKIYKIINKYDEKIEKYKKKNPDHKLENPISINSPKQLAILLYDILNLPSYDKENKRGTGSDILGFMDNDLTREINEYRKISKLLTTYIEALPKKIEKTGRIHCQFNQNGTDTGRLSSTNPNLQNLPSKNKEIRQIFIASDDCVLISADYSAQEPRIIAHLTNDKGMIEAYKQGKDLYAVIASIVFNKPYEQCLEGHYVDGKDEGKTRRNIAKSIVLGVCYGKGIKAIAEDLKIKKSEAEIIYNKIMTEFSGLKKFMESTQNFANKFGYVETAFGRRRRLPNLKLKEYIIKSKSGGNVDSYLYDKYLIKMKHCYDLNDKIKLQKQALKAGLIIKDNTNTIHAAKRKCVNARVQGTAADQTKIAMLKISNNEELKKLGFKLLLVIHDEIIGECPETNIREAIKLINDMMIESGNFLSVPSKCDFDISRRWFGESIKF